jgi:hypothetical protein
MVRSITYAANIPRRATHTALMLSASCSEKIVAALETCFLFLFWIVAEFERRKTEQEPIESNPKMRGKGKN